MKRPRHFRLWLARKIAAEVAPHIPPRYGVSIVGSTFTASTDGPAIELDKDVMTIRGMQP